VPTRKCRGFLGIAFQKALFCFLCLRFTKMPSSLKTLSQNKPLTHQTQSIYSNLAI
jgi:hypothetical protein